MQLCVTARQRYRSWRPRNKNWNSKSRCSELCARRNFDFLVGVNLRFRGWNMLLKAAFGCWMVTFASRIMVQNLGSDDVKAGLRCSALVADSKALLPRTPPFSPDKTPYDQQAQLAPSPNAENLSIFAPNRKNLDNSSTQIRPNANIISTQPLYFFWSSV